MAKQTKPKCRVCRRLGIKLYLKGERCYSSKCALEKNFPHLVCKEWEGKRKSIWLCFTFMGETKIKKDLWNNGKTI